MLEEIAEAKPEPVISISPAELDRLVRRFGDRARQMGRWNVGTDGSLDIPVAVIREAAADLGGRTLHDALREMKAESFSQFPGRSAAVLPVDRICDAYEHHIRQMTDRYQGTAPPAEATQLRDRLVREIFGQ